MEKEFKAIYGQAMSIVTHKPSQYAKNITLHSKGIKYVFVWITLQVKKVWSLIQSQLEELLVDVI